MALMKFGAEKGVGFDIAENMVAWANDSIFPPTRFDDTAQIRIADTLIKSQE